MCGHPVLVEEIRGHLPNVDIFLPNLAEAREMTGLGTAGDCAQALLDAGARVVALKLGNEGCLILRAGERILAPGFDVRARDSTGAGDSFAAGFIAGFLSDLDLPASATVANVMGALAVSRVGAVGASPAAEKALALLNDSCDGLDGRRLQAAIDAAEFLKALTK
jgi:sugar/nucleoside kinase (ribokinase family)